MHDYCDACHDEIHGAMVIRRKDVQVVREGKVPKNTAILHRECHVRLMRVKPLIVEKDGRNW